MRPTLLAAVQQPSTRANHVRPALRGARIAHVLQTGDTTGERAGAAAAPGTHKPEGAAAGDTIDTHEFKFRAGGWASGATLTVRLRDAGLLALEQCLDGAVDVCLYGACVSRAGEWRAVRVVA